MCALSCRSYLFCSNWTKMYTIILIVFLSALEQEFHKKFLFLWFIYLSRLPNILALYEQSFVSTYIRLKFTWRINQGNNNSNILEEIERCTICSYCWWFSVFFFWFYLLWIIGGKRNICEGKTHYSHTSE